VIITSAAENTTVITSKGTIANMNQGTTTISGGTMSNTFVGGNVVYNGITTAQDAVPGTVIINGGTIQAASETEGYAAYNALIAGTITISPSADITGRLHQCEETP